MNELDYALIALMVISIAAGAWRGAIREVMNVISWVLAFILAYAYARDLAPHFTEWVGEPLARLVLAWVLIFISVTIVTSLISNLLTEAVRKLGLGTLDRVVGACIGILRGLIVIVALALVAGLTRMPQTELWRRSVMTPWIEIVALYAKGALPESIAARIRYREPSVGNTAA